MQGVAQNAELSAPNLRGDSGVGLNPGGRGPVGEGGDVQSAFEDFWKPGGFLDDGGTAVGGRDSFLLTNMEGSPSASNSKNKTLLFLVLGLVVLGGVTIFAYLVEWEPMAAITGWMHEDGEDTPMAAPAKNRKVSEEEAPSDLDNALFAENTQIAKSEGPNVVDGNPYWALPNAIEGKSPIGPIWTAVQEEEWRSGISHKYPYQRLKTVMDVRKNRRRGAQTILWEALEDKKAWPRLYASIGLAEYNIPLANKVLAKAIGRARPALISGFFERFVAKPNPGQAYIIRQVIRMLDENGRLTCLRAIWNTRDRFRDLYVAAATLDPGPKVREWVRQVLLQRSMPLERFDELVAMARGKAPFKGFEVKYKDSKQQKGVGDETDEVLAEADSASYEDSDSATQPADGAKHENSMKSKKRESIDVGDVVFFDSQPVVSPVKDQPQNSAESKASP